MVWIQSQAVLNIAIYTLVCRYPVNGQCWQKHKRLTVLPVHCQNRMVS